MSAILSVVFFLLAVCTAFYAGYIVPPGVTLSELFASPTELATSILPYVLASFGFGSAAIALAINRETSKSKAKV